MKICPAATHLLMALALLALQQAAVVAAYTLDYSINEELPLRLEFANVKTDYFDRQKIYTKDGKFNLFQSTQKHRGLFEVDRDTGALLVNSRIDRERLCNKEPVCRVAFKVLLQHSVEEVSVQVNILDVNDCTPAWPEGTSIVVNFREDHPPGHTEPVPAAHDPDLGRNGSVRYQLDNLGAPFGLRSAQEGGQVLLESSQQLDREHRSSYNMTLLAIDDGSPRRTGSIQVIVEVTDVNDNVPQFARSLFFPNRPIFEHEAVNSLILVLNATDPDADSYGQIVFDFAPQLTVGGADRQKQQREARQLFRVTPDGRVILHRSLDYDSMETKSIVFLVIARDNSQDPKNRRTSTATVSVSVWDHNDEPPSVEVCSPAGQCPGVGSVREGPPVGARVAMVIVRDLDTDDRVECRVEDKLMGLETAESSTFELISQYGASEPRKDGNANVWTYSLLTKTQLDREQRPRVCFNIICRDSANQQSGPTRPHCVDVIDINDNAPRLRSPTEPIRLGALEEDSSGRPIGRLDKYFVDDDLGVNSQLNFSIDIRSTEPSSAEAFSIDSDTGLVTPLIILDRERRSRYSFKVRVADRGDPVLSVLVDVAIVVGDVNDHAPKFPSQTAAGQMRVAENRPPPVVVGRVAAQDADSAASGNGRVEYRLEPGTDANAFAVDRNTGEISTRRPLDRELKSHYSFHVLAEDQPQGEPRLTGTCHVTVTVEDVNDNAPVLRIAPPDYPAEFRVQQLEPGHRIGQVLAEDADEGINQKVVYELLNSSRSNHRFSVHGATGSVLVNQPLHDVQPAGQTFPLRIRACDLGSPPLCSQPVEYLVTIPAQSIDVAYRGGNSGSKSDPRTPHSGNKGRGGSGGAVLAGFSNESVIVCLVVTLLVLTVACFAVVCLIFRRRTAASMAATAVHSRAGGAAAAAGAACGTAAMVDQSASELDLDGAHTKMIDQHSAYYCPPNYKNFKEDEYGAYSSTHQLQPRLQFNKLTHATVGRDCRYFSASPSIGRLVDSESASAVAHRQQQLQQHYQTLDSASQQQSEQKKQGQQHQQSLSHLYYEIEGRGGGGGVPGNRAVLSTPQPRRQSRTLPRSGFSVDGKSAGFPSQQQQQQQQLQLQTMQQRAPFCPYTEASFV